MALLLYQSAVCYWYKSKALLRGLRVDEKFFYVNFFYRFERTFRLMESNIKNFDMNFATS